MPVAVPTGSFDSASTKEMEPSAINSPMGAPSGSAFVGTLRLPCLIQSAGTAVTARYVKTALFNPERRHGGDGHAYRHKKVDLVGVQLLHAKLLKKRSDADQDDIAQQEGKPRERQSHTFTSVELLML